MTLPSTSGRKSEHLALAARPDVLHGSGTGLDELRIRHRALPERDLEDVSLETSLLGAQLGAPLLVSAMTGGSADAAEVNRRLARAACRHRLALALGSGRALLDDPGLLGTYVGPDRPPLLLANLGAPQLRDGDGPDKAERLMELLRADGLVIHLNPIQEAVQPEGEPRFAGIADAIAAVVARLRPTPVVVKEVGFGVDIEDVGLLVRAGVAALDVAGAGGTNWALIEGRRDDRAGSVAAAFDRWGVPTVTALRQARSCARGLPLIASGGVRDGVEVAKCLALGATAVGLARPFLLGARDDRADAVAETLVRQLRIAVWSAGAGSAGELSDRHLAGSGA